jgi:dihydrofolate reductase
MPEVTADMMITLDGYATGEGQSREQPVGDLNRELLSAWMFEHRDENAEEVAAITTAGAYIMGRNMFGPDRGEWDLDWQGWWGPNPPYHAPTFVLSHHPRPSLEMEGGPGTLNQYLAAGLVDELRLHVVPLVAGGGERIFDGVGDLELKPVSSRTTPHVTHLVYRR